MLNLLSPVVRPPKSTPVKTMGQRVGPHDLEASRTSEGETQRKYRLRLRQKVAQHALTARPTWKSTPRPKSSFGYDKKLLSMLSPVV